MTTSSMLKLPKIAWPSPFKESQFRILKKCQGKFDCLIYEMLFIKQRNPSLNTQVDSILAKLFV